MREDDDAIQLAAAVSVAGIGRKTLRTIFESRKKYNWNWKDFWVGKSRVQQLCSISQKLSEAIKIWVNENTIDSFLEQLLSKDIRVIVIGSKEYPPLLAPTDDAPVLLFAKGALPDWSKTPIAVVGARNMTRYGKAVTEKLCSELCQNNAQIISGAMYGIDASAHQVAIENKSPTIGVLGYGFDHVYPESIRSLLEAIVNEGGTLYTEYAPTVAPRPGNFVARNSIVAGMSSATLVIEAGQKSGSHITAEFALDAGRLVCAVPGPITNPYSEGTKWLINQGATLVSSGEEVLSELGEEQSFSRQQQPTPPTFETHLEKALYLALESGPKLVSDVLEELAVPFPELQVAITALELAQVLEREGELLHLRYLLVQSRVV